jgi:hypothetical protein
MAEEVADKKKKKEDKPLIKPLGWEGPALTEDQMKGLSEYFNMHRAGVPRYAPLICRGQACEHAAECPLLASGADVPIERSCPIELTLVHKWMEDMAGDLGLEPGAVFDIHSIGAIAVNKLLMKRALQALRDEPIIVDSFRAIAPNGQEITERKLHPAFQAIRDLQKLNQIIQSDLMATRKEKSKDQARKRLSPSEEAKKLEDKMKASRDKVNAKQKQLEAHYRGGDIIEAEFTVREESNGQEGKQGEQVQGEAVRREAGPSVPEGREEEGQEGPGQEERVLDGNHHPVDQDEGRPRGPVQVPVPGVRQDEPGDGATGAPPDAEVTPSAEAKEPGSGPPQPKRDPKTGFLISE